MGGLPLEADPTEVASSSDRTLIGFVWDQLEQSKCNGNTTAKLVWQQQEALTLSEEFQKQYRDTESVCQTDKGSNNQPPAA